MGGSDIITFKYCASGATVVNRDNDNNQEISEQKVYKRSSIE